MKSKEVLKTLNITRQTLTAYVKNGKVRVIVKPNGFYEYNEDDVYRFLGIDIGIGRKKVVCNSFLEKIVDSGRVFRPYIVNVF